MIEYILNPNLKHLDKLTVNRILPSHKQQMIGPWIFMDHFGPATLDSSTALDIRPHPHINLATVSYLLEGEITHRDSLGNIQTTKPNEIGLMIAGKGITHSEREPQENRDQTRVLHGLQLWLALPLEFEEVEPKFLHYSESALPTFKYNNAQIKLLIGKAWEHKSPVKTFCDTLLAHIELQTNTSLDIPIKEQIGVYVLSGEIKISDQKISKSQLAILENTTNIKAFCDSTIIILGGDKLGERFIKWNFVSSKETRINQAIKDWQENKFDKVIDDEDEFIPYPTR